MRAALEALDRQYGDLSGFVQARGQPASAIQRQLENTAFYVTLYAVFERFAEELAWSFADLRAKNEQYLNLPPQLQAKHMTVTAELLGRRMNERRYAGVRKADLVANLHGCLSGQTPYQLNKHAITGHDANLWSEVLQGMFAAVGIDRLDFRVRNTESLVDWYRDTTQAAEASEVPALVTETRLNEIIERRNDAAHGGQVDELVGSEGMQDALTFLSAYSKALVDVVTREYLRARYVSSNLAPALVQTESPKLDGYVVIVEAPQAGAYVGQAAFSCISGDVNKWGQINEIQVDGEPINEVWPSSTTTTLGLRLSFKPGASASIYLLSDPDHSVWPTTDTW